MNIYELKQKAQKFITERRWDILLIEAYLITKDLDSRGSSSLGIKNISVVNKEIIIGHIKKEAKFVLGEINGISFEIGGFYDFSLMAEGCSATVGVSLCIEDNIVFTGSYLVNSDDPLLASDYSIYSVEEFHNNDLIHHLLKALHDAKVEQSDRLNEVIKLENEKKYAGKFTF